MIRQPLNHGWTVAPGDGGGIGAIFEGNANPPKAVTLPHDFPIEQPRDPSEPHGSGNGFFHQQDMVYNTVLDLDASAEGKRVWLEIEGAYQNAFVYVNGSFAGKHPYGYGSFSLDLTDFVQPGHPNRIKVLCKTGVPSGRWYTGGGLYRGVNLMIAEPLHFAPEGVFVRTENLDESMAEVAVGMEVTNDFPNLKTVTLVAELKDSAGCTVAKGSMPLTLRGGCTETCRLRLYVPHPILWDAEHPNLYSYQVSLAENGTVLDTETGHFGIRRLQLDPVNGLRVNGRTVKLRGGCIHSDNGILGTKEFPFAADERIRVLKELGFNAIRSAHNPISRRLLEACDKYGMYVMDEYSDVWTSCKVPYDYGMHMTEWWQQDLAAMVKKDRNHPCVLMYSIGNEIPETGNRIDAMWGKKLADRLRELDPTRYVVNSLNLMFAGMDQISQLMAGVELPGEINALMNTLGDEMDNLTENPLLAHLVEEAAGQVDIVGLNYATGRYEPEGTEYPNRIIVGSETNPADLDRNWALVEKLPYLLGDFDWTAWDYLGETGIGGYIYGETGSSMGAMFSPYPWKAGYCGNVNLLGDARPVAYWRQMIWGLRKAPYIAVRPPEHYGQRRWGSQWCFSDALRSWTHKGYEGKGITVEVYAPADEVELLVNGVSLGRRPTGDGHRYIAVFDTVYTPGTLEAIAYTSGVETGRDVLSTAGSRVQLSASVKALAGTNGKATLPADGSDIGYVDLSVVDENGLLNTDVPLAVEISLEGPGELAGYGSASPANEENFYDTVATTFEGRLRAAVRATGKGEIRLHFSSGELCCTAALKAE